MAKRIDKKSMSCNRPKRSPNPKKKRVVKACQDGKEKIIHFGATGYGHNISGPARKSFRARHGCDKASTKNNKLSARYWACKTLWSASTPPKRTGSKGRVARRK